ncbi:MAG TPA: helix-turn-helix domain-containing protein [Bacillota bacterium]|nr:helix-turn-helix domain-containing protein [Bacillota bacterium]
MNSIGEKIAKLRKQKGMTQEELAGIIGVSAQSVSKWENSTTMPDIILLPIIANAFEVSIDALFGKSMVQDNYIPAEEAFDSACDSLKKVIVSTENHGYNAEEPFNSQYEKYNRALSEDGRTRSVIMRNHGIIYYRNEVGGLLLKKPKNGWRSLLDDENAAKIISLLANQDFRKAMSCVTKTGMNTFTLSSLCRNCGVEDSAELEKSLIECGLFTAKKLEIDDKTVTVYELTCSHRLFVLFAVLQYAKEFAEYNDICYYYYGDPSFYQN